MESGCLVGRKHSSETHAKEQKDIAKAEQLNLPTAMLYQIRNSTHCSRVLSPYTRRFAGLKAYIAQRNGCSEKRLLIDVRVEGKLLRF